MAASIWWHTTPQNMLLQIISWLVPSPFGYEMSYPPLVHEHTMRKVEHVQLLVENYPETLVIKDKWGDTPLFTHFRVMPQKRSLNSYAC